MVLRRQKRSGFVLENYAVQFFVFCFKRVTVIMVGIVMSFLIL